MLYGVQGIGMQSSDRILSLVIVFAVMTIMEDCRSGFSAQMDHLDADAGWMSKIGEQVVHLHTHSTPQSQY